MKKEGDNLNKLKLILVLAILVEVFIFKSKHITSFFMWAGDILGKILNDAIMNTIMDNLNN